MQGTLFVCLYTNQSNFLGNPPLVIQKPVSANAIEVEFPNLAYGYYAITAYQDLNANKILDMAFVFPQEPWGLSKNFTPTLGPPKFDDCKFLLDAPVKKIEIEMKKIAKPISLAIFIQQTIIRFIFFLD